MGMGIQQHDSRESFTRRHAVLSIIGVTAMVYLLPSIEFVREMAGFERRSIKKRPLMIFPLLKELGAGWYNMQPPPLLQKRAHGSRSLIVDVGLDKGEEFFLAIENGFEVVGFEPNPVSFPALAQKCRSLTTSTCHVLEDPSSQSLPLNRTAGDSYLVHAAVGAVAGELDLFTGGSGSSFQPNPNARNEKSKWKRVPVVRIDDFIREDVYLFKIDTQGFDPFVLQGAAKLFRDHVVRHLIFEVEPLAMTRNKITITETMEMVQDYGMLCFLERLDVGLDCEFRGDTVEKFEEMYFSEKNVRGKAEELWAPCWEDFVCINIEKPWPGAELPVLGFDGVGAA
ncbi:hypothetical protein ACHAXA_007469 [Cyclostephanos tholiformis]|uniref:Methyltransferase FkbM domain-containing protein n=1 Tax=Cyclostephanos tholiformis TaxID=382380 RepID=A0ABD3RTM1_9STRA